MELTTILILVAVVAYILYSKWKSSQPFEEYPNNKVTEMKDLTQFNVILKTGGIVVTDFFATWCPPCRASAPHYGKLSTEYDSNNVTFLKVNVDNARAIASQENIKQMPTFKIYNNGVCVETIVGYRENQIKQKIGNLLQQK